MVTNTITKTVRFPIMAQMIRQPDGRYQVSSSAGLTVVIVPTVALALDQYYAAKENLKDANGLFCYRGDQSSKERVSILTAIHDKTARLLFTSPEAVLKNSELFNLLRKFVSIVLRP